MDTIGHIDRRSGVCQLRFSQKQQRLIETVPVFLKSLGLKVNVKDNERTNTRRFSFMVTKDMFMPVTLPAKVEQIRDTLSKQNRH